MDPCCTKAGKPDNHFPEVEISKCGVMAGGATLHAHKRSQQMIHPGNVQIFLIRVSKECHISTRHQSARVAISNDVGIMLCAESPRGAEDAASVSLWVVPS